MKIRILFTLSMLLFLVFANAGHPLAGGAGTEKNSEMYSRLLDKITANCDFRSSLIHSRSGPLWIVFDNVQEASAESGLLEVIRHAMGRGAPGVKICAISRNEAPPVMVRALANQTLVSLGWPDLAFSVTEYAEIIKKLAPRMPADKIAGRLHRQTKGWISGLILCLQQDADDLVLADLPEGHTRIFDYFAAESLHTLTPLWRRFLLQSSLLDGMSAESAARMTGIDCAGDILESLTERNSFIEKHPGPVTIYRYHPLFRDFLGHYLARTMAPEAVRSLYRRAAAILAESGSMNEAVSLYSSGKDWDGLAEAILTHAPDLIAQGRHQTLQGWLGLCIRKPEPGPGAEPGGRPFRRRMRFGAGGGDDHRIRAAGISHTAHRPGGILWFAGPGRSTHAARRFRRHA